MSTLMARSTEDAVQLELVHQLPQKRKNQQYRQLRHRQQKPRTHIGELVGGLDEATGDSHGGEDSSVVEEDGDEDEPEHATVVVPVADGAESHTFLQLLGLV